MSSDRRSLIVPSLVYLGAAILIGIPAMMVLFHAFSVLLHVLELEAVLDSPAGLIFLGISLLLGLQLAVEVAAVQLGGVEALGRGSPRVAIVRYLLFTTVAFVTLLAATWIGLSTAIAGFGWPAAGLGLLVVLAGLFALYRSSSAFVAGFRGNDG